MSTPSTRQYSALYKSLKEVIMYTLLTEKDQKQITEELNAIGINEEILKKYIHSKYTKQEKKILEKAQTIIKRNNKIDEKLEKIKKEKEEKAFEKRIVETNFEEQLNLLIPNKEDIAEKLYQINPYFYDRIGLFWFWNKNRKCYEMIDEITLILMIKKHSAMQNFQVSENKFYSEIIRSLKIIGRKYQPKNWNINCIQFGDCVYDFNLKVSYDPDPRFFNTNPIPHNIKIIETPVIDKLFKEWVGEEHVLSLKQTIGLSCLQDYPLHRIICLFGSGLNGKGRFLALLNKFIGDKNICSSNLNKLIKSNFETSKLYKKLCCIMGETSFGEINDTAIIKQLSGQDLISAEFKGKNGFDYYNYATLFIASNSLPISLDVTDGFFRRWMIIDFPNRFKEGPDPIKTIPDEEFEGLGFQILELLPNLLHNGVFDVDGDISQRRSRYEEKSNPIKLFVELYYDEDVNNDVPFFEFYDEFVGFCKERGFRELTKKSVSRVLRDLLGLETEKKDVKVGEDWKKWVHIIGLKKKISNRSNRSNPTSTPFLIRENRVQPGFDRYERDEKVEKTNPIVDLIHLPCNYCGSKISITEDLQGRPACEMCSSDPNLQKKFKIVGVL